MLGRFLKTKRWPIGLDIGTDSIRMLQLHQSGSIVSVVAAGQHKLGGALPESLPERRKAMVAGIREILHRGKFAGRQVVSALPSHQLNIKNVRIAHGDDRQLALAVRSEARERFGFEIGPDQLRWINAGQVRQGDEVRSEIIMMAVPQEFIDDHLAMLDEAGLVPRNIEPEPIALFRVFRNHLRRRDDEEAVSVIVDIGRSATKVTIARGPNIVFIKRVEIGGSKFTEAVAKQLNLSPEEAADLRLRMMKEVADPSGADRQGDPAAGPAADEAEPGEKMTARNKVDWTVHDAMRGEIEELSKEIALCLRYCAVTFRGLRPSNVVLTGGEAYDALLVKLLADNLGVPCVVGRPLHGIDVSSMDVAANRRGTLAEWAVCAGLAEGQMEQRHSAAEDDHDRHRLSA